MKSPARPFVRHPFNYDQDRASVLSGLSCPEPTMAQQQFRDECNINTIVERFGLTGQLPVGVRPPEYGDFTQVSDFQSAMQAVRQAQETFMLFPANVRERFGNDPQQLLEFVSDESNLEEAVSLGLAMPREADPSTSTPPSS